MVATIHLVVPPLSCGLAQRRVTASQNHTNVDASMIKPARGQNIAFRSIPKHTRAANLGEVLVAVFSGRDWPLRVIPCARFGILATSRQLAACNHSSWSSLCATYVCSAASACALLTLDISSLVDCGCGPCCWTMRMFLEFDQVPAHLARQLHIFKR